MISVVSNTPNRPPKERHRFAPPSAEAARQPPPQQKLIVENTSIDTEFTVGEPIDFMKIDVQGGETRVLLGVDGMLQDPENKPFSTSNGRVIRG